jgi:hypothetical protein
MIKTVKVDYFCQTSSCEKRLILFRDVFINVFSNKCDDAYNISLNDRFYYTRRSGEIRVLLIKENVVNT